MVGIGLALGLTIAGFQGTPTDFGIRAAPGSAPLDATERRHASASPISSSTNAMESAVEIGRSMGIVTSTVRTPEHNRRVGGVPNSHHLSGRAIDIARRPGVRHSEIDAAFRNQGFELIESLDEGDHSHIAFRRPASPPDTPEPETADEEEERAPRHPGWTQIIAPGG